MNTKTLRIGDTDVARIGLGTNRLTNSPENVAFIKEAVGLGVGMIDTAYTYTGGQSEQTIGDALSPIPESCIVATKGGYAPGTGRPEVLRTQIDESLRRLKTDEIDLYYLHRVHEDTMLQDSVGTLAAYHDAGKIRHVGLSQVGIDQIEQAREIVPITAVQKPLQPLRTRAGRGRRPLRPRGHRVRSLLPAQRERRSRGGRDRRASRSHRRADPPGMAPAAVAGDAADPGHAFDRAPEGEPGGAGGRAHRRRVRRPVVTWTTPVTARAYAWR
jgi:aryl-alcohol dehydrogenase-like predicted oxidoreductase